MKKKVLVQSLVVSATIGSVAAVPLQAHAEQTEQATTTQETVQKSFDEVKYQALEQVAISAVEKARQELQSAKDLLTKLEEAAKKGITGAEKEVADQQAALKEAEIAVTAAKEALKKEEEKLATVKARHKNVVAMAEAEIATVEKLIKEKEIPYLEAKEMAEKAEATVNEKIEAWQQVDKQQQAIIGDAQAEIDKVEEAYQLAREDFLESETAIQEAELALQAIVKEINNQQNVINEAINEKVAAQHAVEDAQIRVGEAIANYPVMDAASNQAKAIYEAAVTEEANRLPMINQEITTMKELVISQEAILAAMDPSDPAYSTEQAKLSGYQAALQYSQDELAMLAAEKTQALNDYNAAKQAADNALAEISASETAYQESLINKEVTNKAADEKIAAAEEMMTNRDKLITEAETKVQLANLAQQEKLKAMNKAEVTKNKVIAEQQAIIEKAKAEIAKSFDEISMAETAFQEANLTLQTKEKEYSTVKKEQQLVIDFSKGTIQEADAELKAQEEAMAQAQKVLDEAEQAVKELKALVATAKKKLEAVKADAKEKLEAAQVDVTNKEVALKQAEDRLAGLRAGANDARTGKLKATNAGMSLSYQQGYEDAYALLTMTSKNVLVQTSTVQEKNSSIKEYKKVVPATSKELPQTGDAESLATVLMGLGLISFSGAVLLKKKYTV